MLKIPIVVPRFVVKFAMPLTSPISPSPAPAPMSAKPTGWIVVVRAPIPAASTPVRTIASCRIFRRPPKMEVSIAPM